MFKIRLLSHFVPNLKFPFLNCCFCTVAIGFLFLVLRIHCVLTILIVCVFFLLRTRTGNPKLGLTGSACVCHWRLIGGLWIGGGRGDEVRSATIVCFGHVGKAPGPPNLSHSSR